MNLLEEELIKHLESLHLKEKGWTALSEVKKGIIKDGGKIDGYAIEELIFNYSRQEVRLLNSLQSSSILARFDIFIKHNEWNNRIGYYDFIVDFNGNFLDEYFVIDK